jgi:hypothetical protein
MKPNQRQTLLSAFLLALACSTDQIVGVGAGDQVVLAPVGNVIEISLPNPGIGVFDPPAMTSNLLSFIGEQFLPSANDGPTEKFLFMANRMGTTVVTFKRVLGDSVSCRRRWTRSSCTGPAEPSVGRAHFEGRQPPSPSRGNRR